MKRIMAFLLIIAAFTAFSAGALAQAHKEATEDEVKAAFLYRFTGFVEWPTQVKANEAIVIGVLNADTVENELRRYVQSGKYRGRSVSVRRLDTAEDLSRVHVLFIGARENARLSRIISRVRNLPILTITEASDGLERGSIINFVTTDRVQFEIAADNAAKAGIHLNARLLSVAMRVKTGEGPPDDTRFAFGGMPAFLMRTADFNRPGQALS